MNGTEHSRAESAAVRDLATSGATTSSEVDESVGGAAFVDERVSAVEARVGGAAFASCRKTNQHCAQRRRCMELLTLGSAGFTDRVVRLYTEKDSSESSSESEEAHGCLLGDGLR